MPPTTPGDSGPGGFEVDVTLEQIKEFRRLTAEQKLDWLSNAQQFVWELSSPQARRFQELFRQGRI